MNHTIVFESLYFILACVILYYIMNAANNIIRINKEKNDIAAFDIHVKTAADKEAIVALDTLIEDCLTEYVILNLGFEKTKHINQEEEQKIIYAVAQMVEERISPILLDKLNFFYHEQAIFDVIGKKVYIKVMNYVLINNDAAKNQ